MAAYLWAAFSRGKLHEDDLGFAHMPTHVVAVRHGGIVLDERVALPLMMPRRGSPLPTSSYQAQRDMLTIVKTALSVMQRNALEAIAQVGMANVNTLREIIAAQAASMERAQQTLERLWAVIADAKRVQAQTDTQRAHEMPRDPEVNPEAASDST